MSDTGWRLLAPAKLLGTALLCLLPWINISCVATEDGKTTKMPFMSQTGVQIATGDFTVEMLGGMEQEGNEQFEKQRKENAGPITVKIFIAMVLVAAVAGLVLKLGSFRTAILAISLTIGIGMLGLQTFVGFPVVNGLKQDGGGLGGRGGGGFGPDRDMKWLVEYEPALFGVWILSVGALVTTVLEVPLRKKPKPAGPSEGESEKIDWGNVVESGPEGESPPGGNESEAESDDGGD